MSIRLYTDIYMSEHPVNQEKLSYPSMIFIPETDSFGETIKADGAQIRLNPNQEWSDILVMRGKEVTSLGILRPGGTEESASGNTFFIYGDTESGNIHIAPTEGSFDAPKRTILIGANVPASIISFKPEVKPDYKLKDKSLQPIALVSKDHNGQFIISRKFNERADVSPTTNAISFTPSKFELTYPNATLDHAVAAFTADLRKEQKEEEVRHKTIREIKDLARIASLRLAHKNKHLPEELKPNCNYDPESKTYEVTLYVSPNGRDKIMGRENLDEDLSQVGDDYGFGSKLLITQNKESSNDGPEIKWSVQISEYNENQERALRTLVDNLVIENTDRSLSENLLHDKLLDPVYSVNFSSHRPDDVINVLAGIDRGLKPRYLPPGELGAT